MSELLFSPFELKGLTLKNRVVMAPMTRGRASEDHVPTPIMADYYGQRASAGLIISEGVSPSADGLGYARIPGLFNAAHVAAWRPVTDAVHQKGGRIFVQLMHTGRASHHHNMPAGARVVAPSAIRQPGEIWTDQAGQQPCDEPEALDAAGIRHVVEEFAASARLAIEAGFDGVELHGANGYLLDQFLNPASNQRTDEHGGSPENRARFVLEVAEAVVAAIGAGRTGIRLSPGGVFNGMGPDPEFEALYSHLARRLGELGLAYIHVVDHSAMGAPELPAGIRETIRSAFGGVIILSGGYDRARAESELAAGLGELVAFGRPFLANPDLVRRLKEERELAQPDFNLLYAGGEKGYCDYPALD